LTKALASPRDSIPTGRLRKLEVDIDRVEAARRRNHRDVRSAQLVDPHAQHQFVGFSIFLARFSPICVGIAFLRGGSTLPSVACLARARETSLAIETRASTRLSFSADPSTRA